MRVFSFSSWEYFDFRGLSDVFERTGAVHGINATLFVAYSVSQQTREIGIRMALGARPRDVLRLALGEGWRLAAIGLSAGTVAALVSTHLMRSLVFDVSTTDPLTFAVTGGLLGAVALFASYIPARRATHIDPMMALRHE